MKTEIISEGRRMGDELITSIRFSVGECFYEVRDADLGFEVIFSEDSDQEPEVVGYGFPSLWQAAAAAEEMAAALEIE